MKLFISHANADEKLATKFVNMLQLGIGAPHGDIFYSSAKGAIPNGQFFVRHILKELNSADAVIALLSRAYFESHFCLSEAGAALARATRGDCEFFSLVVPPITFANLDGMLYGVQSGSILERPALGEMKDLIQSKMTTIPPGSHIWDQKRDEFLSLANDVVASYEIKEALSKISVVDYRWSREEGSNVYVHSKIRVTFRNETGRSFEIEEGRWNSGNDGIPPYEKSRQLLKWRLKPADEEKVFLSVPADSGFRTWIGLADSVTGEDCLNRSATKHTGTMHLKLKVGKHSLNHEIRF